MIAESELGVVHDASLPVLPGSRASMHVHLETV